MKIKTANIINGESTIFNPQELGQIGYKTSCKIK